MTVKLPRRILTFSIMVVGLILVLFSLSTAVQARQVTTTFYGAELAGNPTASGEIFNPNEYTAAHKTLPFGTKLKVTYDGRSVVVRINDRGPFVEGRELDLARRPAAYLGLVGLGPTEVQIERVDPSTPVGPYSGNASSSQAPTQPEPQTQAPSEPEQPASEPETQPAEPSGVESTGNPGENQQNGQSGQDPTGTQETGSFAATGQAQQADSETPEQSGETPTDGSGNTSQVSQNEQDGDGNSTAFQAQSVGENDESNPSQSQTPQQSGGENAQQTVENTPNSGDDQQNDGQSGQGPTSTPQSGVGSFSATDATTAQGAQYEQYCDDATSSQYKQYCNDDGNDTSFQAQSVDENDESGPSQPQTPPAEQTQTPQQSGEENAQQTAENAPNGGDNQQNDGQSGQDLTSTPQSGVGSFSATDATTVQGAQYEQYCDDAASSQYKQYCNDDGNDTSFQAQSVGEDDDGIATAPAQHPAENASGGEESETTASGAPQHPAEADQGQHKAHPQQEEYDPGSQGEQYKPEPQKENETASIGSQQSGGGAGGGSSLGVLPDTGSALPLTALAGGMALFGIGGLLRKLTEW